MFCVKSRNCLPGHADSNGPIQNKKSVRLKKEQQIIQAHQQYVDLARLYIKRARFDIDFLKRSGISSIDQLMVIEHFIMHAERQIDQILRRVINDEKIAHSEKGYSLYLKNNTEWISKGKAGVPQELGLKVCILEDQYGFILHHQCHGTSNR